MTSNKAAKRAIRARMAKTGERYAAARSHLVSPTAPPDDARENPASAGAIDTAPDRPNNAAEASAPSESATDPTPRTLPPRVAEPAMTDDAILRGTSRTWDEWFALLDDWGATAHTHADIARHIDETWSTGGWWAQTVTVGYERARGMRAPNQRPDGFFVSASKTIAAPAATVHTAFVEDALRNRWLEPGTLRLRTQQPARSARFDVLPDAGRLMLTITEKGPGKTLAAIEHGRLTSPDEVEARRAFWRERLARLAALAPRLDLPHDDRDERRPASD